MAANASGRKRFGHWQWLVTALPLLVVATLATPAQSWGNSDSHSSLNNQDDNDDTQFCKGASLRAAG